MFNDQPEAEIGKFVGIQPAPGKPPPNFGQFYCSVRWGGGQGRARNPNKRHDVYQGVTITLTARLGYAPRDRQGIRLATVGDFYDLVDQIAGQDVIHGSNEIFRYANELIPGTQHYLDLHDPDGVATVNGYYEPLVLVSFGPEREADAAWVGTETAPKNVFVTDIRFADMRRTQSNE